MTNQDKTTQEIIKDLSNSYLNIKWRPVSVCEQREKELLNEFFNDLSKLKEDTEINLRSEKTQNEIKEFIKPLLKQAVDEAIKQEHEKILNQMQKIINKEKARCDEANAFTCWHILKEYLKKESETK